jgi:hypothetical protein
MKFLVCVSILFVTNIQSQIIKIQNKEVQSFYGDTTQTVSEVFENPRMTQIKNSEIIYKAPISVSKIKNTIQVKILDGFDNGLLIEMTDHQSVTWYLFTNDLVEYQKWIDFDIIKTY